VRLSGATVLLTGGSSGIGAATARMLAAAGARILLAGRNAARLQAVAAETGGIALVADLAVPDGPAKLAEAAIRAAAWDCGGCEAAAAGNGIDILINNAGVGWAGPLTEMSAATVAQVIAVNLTAPIELTRLLTPTLGAGGRGRVVFISSIAGTTGVTHEAVYAATKAGLGCFAESLWYELAGTDVGVSVVVPGAVDTPFFARRGHPYGRTRPVPVSAQRVARAVLIAIERDQAMTFVPRWFGFPAWLHGAAPGTFRALAARFG